MSTVARLLVLLCLSSCAPAPPSVVTGEPAPAPQAEPPAAPDAVASDTEPESPESPESPEPPEQADRPPERGDAVQAEATEAVPAPDGSMFPDMPQEVTVTPPTVGGPTDRPPADHDRPCGDGVCDGPESEQPDLCPRDCQDKPVRGSDWCGDGVCDALEQRDQSCAKDCEGARLHGPPEVGEGDDPAQED